MILRLKRVSTSPKGTFGVLMGTFVPLCVTLELPWNNNAEDTSCIPIGTYLCKRIKSPKFGETFEITGVDRRTYILFHHGNTIKDTNGCILLGRSFDYVLAAVTESVKTRAFFMKWMDRTKEFTLVVS